MGQVDPDRLRSFVDDEYPRVAGRPATHRGRSGDSAESPALILGVIGDLGQCVSHPVRQVPLIAGWAPTDRHLPSHQTILRKHPARHLQAIPCHRSQDREPSALGGAELHTSAPIAVTATTHQDALTTGPIRGLAGSQTRSTAGISASDLVPGVGLEPTRPFGQRILSPPRLPFRHPGQSGTLLRSSTYPEPMSDSTNTDDGGSHMMRWLLFIALAIAGAAAGRQWALSKADAEFEARLKAADERRH